MANLLTPLGFDQLDWRKIEAELGKSLDDENNRTDDDSHRLCCVYCNSPITAEDQRIPMQGKHRHRFTNPHGMVFHIGCFASAPGCAQIGPATEEWTWFSGYAWQIAVCRSCGRHLGWRYRNSGGNSFYGLILERLVAARLH